jgi:hypothetical protein
MAPCADAIRLKRTTGGRARIDYRCLATRVLHPTEVAIIELIAFSGMPEWTPIAMSKVLDQPLQHVSYHVRKLVSVTILEPSRVGRRRGATTHFYRLADELIT